MNRIKAVFAGLTWACIGFMVVSLIVGICFGCSATKKIAASAALVVQNATDIRSEVVSAKHDLKAGNTAGVNQRLETIDGHAAVIQAEVKKVQEALPDVQDRVPYWAVLLKWSLVASAIGGVIFLLWRFNLLLVIESAIQIVMSWVHKWLGKLMGA